MPSKICSTLRVKTARALSERGSDMASAKEILKKIEAGETILMEMEYLNIFLKACTIINKNTKFYINITNGIASISKTQDHKGE
jgi:hypothetical protein